MAHPAVEAFIDNLCRAISGKCAKTLKMQIRGKMTVDSYSKKAAPKKMGNRKADDVVTTTTATLEPLVELGPQSTANLADKNRNKQVACHL